MSSKLYYVVPMTSLVAGMLALVMVGMVPTQMGSAGSIVAWRTLSVLAFGTANWLIALTFVSQNRFGLYSNTLLLILLVTLLLIFGNHMVTGTGLKAFGALIASNVALIILLHHQLPR